MAARMMVASIIGKKGFISMIVKWIFYIVMFIVVVAGGLMLFGKATSLFSKNVPMNDTSVGGPTLVTGGVTYKVGIDPEVQKAFTDYVAALRPEESDCISLVPFPDAEVFKINRRLRKDYTYRLEDFEGGNGRVIRLIDEKEVIIGRTYDANIQPCVIAGATGGVYNAKRFKACLENDFEGCLEIGRTVPEIVIAGNEMERFSVPSIKAGDYKSQFVTYKGTQVLAFYKGVKDTCVIATGGSDDGNEKGISKDTLQHYLDGKPKLCGSCFFGGCADYTKETCQFDRCGFGCTPNAGSAGFVCDSCGKISTCADYKAVDGCNLDKCHKRGCAWTGDTCITCKDCQSLPSGSCDMNPCGYQCKEENGACVPD